MALLSLGLKISYHSQIGTVVLRIAAVLMAGYGVWSFIM